MTLWIFALVGVILLTGVFVCSRFEMKTAAPVYRYLTIILGVIAALCFFYCVSAFLLIAGIE